MAVRAPQPSSRALNQVQEQHRRTLTALSTGKRINRAGDDPAGLAIAKKFDVRQVSLSQAGRNLADASSIVQVAEGGLSEATSIVSRLKELAVQAGSGILSDSQRGALQSEATGLQEELSRLQETTEFNGQKVFQDGLSLEVQAGDDAGESIAIDPGGEFVSPLGLDSIDLSSASGARDALGALDVATESLVGRQADLGATANRFGIASSVNSGSRVAIEAARSRIEDADIAETTAQSVATRIREQVAVGIHSQANFTQSVLGSLYEGIG